MDEGRDDRATDGAGAAPTPWPRSGAVLGTVLVVAGALGWFVWFAWRLSHPVAHPLWALAVVVEGLGVITGLTVAVTAARHRRGVVTPHRRRTGDGSAYVRGVVGLTSRSSPHPDPLTDASRQAVLHAHRVALARHVDAGDRARALALLEAPRRLVFALTLTAGLLLGVATHARPTTVAVVGAAVGIVAISVGTWLLSAGSIRPGDRTLWSFAAIGPLFRSGRTDPAERAFGGVASVERAGVMGLIVIMNLAVSLRGISDRWTHGLPDMALDDRVGVMSMAIVTVLAGLAVLVRLPDPDPVDEIVLPRRLEERSARQTALAATVAVAIVGFVAGILPGAVDAGDGPAGERTEVVSQTKLPGGAVASVDVIEHDLEPHPAEVGDAVVVDPAQMATENPDEP
jgi:hypothetical protein